MPASRCSAAAEAKSLRSSSMRRVRATSFGGQDTSLLGNPHSVIQQGLPPVAPVAWHSARSTLFRRAARAAAAVGLPGCEVEG